MGNRRRSLIGPIDQDMMPDMLGYVLRKDDNIILNRIIESLFRYFIR